MIPLLTSELLTRAGFVHGFSTRNGGVSVPPFATLNLARAVGDDPEAVAENYRRFSAALGILPSHLYETEQVHGEAVRFVTDGDDLLATRTVPADALVTHSPGLAVGVRVADCVPILLADVRTGAVAAVHAGWRGCVAHVLDRAIDVLAERAGSRPKDLLAAIGPHISLEAFEVGEEVAEAIAAVAHGEPVVSREYSKPHVDLGRTVRAQLLHRGLREETIEHVPGCTYREPVRFHSFRRDGKRSGRLLGAIVSPSSSAGNQPSSW